ncbi:hypothetical protein RSP822_17140 [Ralstonia solanacearum]|nr:hypothetical protein RSP822_17140 [Ralstonia solanacearum]
MREVLDDPVELLAKMRTASLDASDILHAPVFLVAAELNSNDSVFIRAIAGAVRAGLPKFEIYTFMLPVVGYCRGGEPEAIVDMLSAFAETWNELPDNSVPLLSQLCTHKPDLALDSLGIALASATLDPRVPQTLAMVTAVVSGLSATSYLLNLAQSTEIRYVQAGLAGLCAIDVDKWRDEHAPLDAMVPVAMSATQRDELQHLSYRLLNHLSIAHSGAESVVAEAVVSGNDAAQLETARWLRFMARQVRYEHASRMLEVLTCAAEEAPRVRAEVEATIMSLIYRPETEALGLVGLDHIGCFVSGHLDGEYPQLYSAIVSDNERYKRVVTRWLLAPEISLTAVRSLLAYAQASPGILHPDVAAFVQANPAARTKAIRRLVGLCYNGAAIAGFLADLAADASTESWALQAFSEVLGNYLRVEYPAETRSFLEARLPLAAARSKLQRLMKRGLNSIREWDDVLKALPVLKELQPAQEKLITLRLADQKRNREINRCAREKSVFAKLATQVHIKQGRKVVTKMPDGTSAVTPLIPHSVHFEIPGSEVADPLLGHLARHRFLAD